MGCGGRIRTGDTRRMKPLPYHLATPLLFWKNWHGVPVLPRIRKGLESSLRKLTPAVCHIKMERPAGLAPAFPDWKSEVLLLDDDRFVKNENKHHCQTDDGLAPAGKFLGGSFGVSGTPPVTRTIVYIVLPKPLVCIFSRAENRDNAGPSASLHFDDSLWTRGRHPSLRLLTHSRSLAGPCWIVGRYPPPSVVADDWLFTPVCGLVGNHVNGKMVWFEWRLHRRNP